MAFGISPDTLAISPSDIGTLMAREKERQTQAVLQREKMAQQALLEQSGEASKMKIAKLNAQLALEQRKIIEQAETKKVVQQEAGRRFKEEMAMKQLLIREAGLMGRAELGEAGLMERARMGEAGKAERAILEESAERRGLETKEAGLWRRKALGEEEAMKRTEATIAGAKERAEAAASAKGPTSQEIKDSNYIFALNDLASEGKAYYPSVTAEGIARVTEKTKESMSELAAGFGANRSNPAIQEAERLFLDAIQKPVSPRGWKRKTKETIKGEGWTLTPAK